MGDNFTPDNSRFVVRMFHDTTLQVDVKAQCRGGPLTTLKALANSMDDAIQDGGEQRIRDSVVTSLSNVGASQEFCDFFAEALQCEHDMTTTIYKLQQTLKFDRRKPPNPAKLLKAIQDLIKSFNSWKGVTDQLINKGRAIPPFKLAPDALGSSKILKALCSLETKDVQLQEGEMLTIMDVSHPNQLGVINSKGEEGYIPALCCILPSPDKNALSTAERLRIQLLASWTESVKKTQKLLLESLNGQVRYLAGEWKVSFLNGSESSRDRVTRRFKRIIDTVTKQAPAVDFTKLHNTLFSLERELGSWNVNGTDMAKMVDTVANLDRSVLCHQMFHKNWSTYRKCLEKESRPIRIVDGLDDLKVARPGKCYKYFEVKMTLENVETVEEILFVNKDRNFDESRGDSWTEESGTKRQSVRSDQLTTHEQEVKRKYLIRSVTDPITQSEISIKDAIDKGIVIMERGIYANPESGAYLTIPEAMQRDLIKVEFVSTRKSAETTSAIGLITIKTRTDNRFYDIQTVVDSFSGEQLTCDEARLKGIVDVEKGYYIVGATGERITLDSAIEGGWVIPAYDPDEPTYDVKTYAVSAVVDQRLRKKVPFIDAVRRGLIEKHTGNYVNNVTREKVYVADAISRGFLQAKPIKDQTGLTIEPEHSVVVEKDDSKRRSILKPCSSLDVPDDATQAAQTETQTADTTSEAPADTKQ